MSSQPAQTKPGTPLPAYLVVGDDALKRERIVAGIARRLSQMGDMSFNTESFDGEVAEGPAIANACRTVPFLSPYRLVTVSNADKLRKADSEELVSYLKASNRSTVLVLSAEKLAKSTRLYKAVGALGAKAVIECVAPKARDLPNLVREMAPAHGATMTADAAHKLVELVGENTVRLDAEVAKLALLHEGSQPIGVREVARTSSGCPSLRGGTSRTPSRPATPPVACACWSRWSRCRPIRSSACARTACASSWQRSRSIQHRTPNATAQALGKQDWQVRSVVADARRFSASELERALLGARETEIAMNSGKDADAAFLEWVLSVTAPSKR